VTPAELDRIRERLAPHRADQAAVEASPCYAADTCTLDPGCPFAAHCAGVCGQEDE
jgi:hypothetical protein